MKFFLILFFNSAFIFISCKCTCEGDKPAHSIQNKKLLIFKNDTVIDFMRNEADIVQLNVSSFNQEIMPEAVCVGLNALNSCICPIDAHISDGYTQQSVKDSINFQLTVNTDKEGSRVQYSINRNSFNKFDSTNISKIINNRLLTGLSLKEFTNNYYDSIIRIYYKDSLGLVSVEYKNGTRIDLK